MKRNKSVNCGNWGEGWGLNGKDKIGKLSYDSETDRFTWKGHSQGRHGQKWNRGAMVVFTYENGVFNFIEQKGSVPPAKNLIEGINELMKSTIAKS